MLADAVESAVRGHPEVPEVVLENLERAVVEEPFARRDAREAPVLESPQPAVIRADPERAVCVLVERANRIARKAVALGPARELSTVESAQTAEPADPEAPVPPLDDRSYVCRDEAALGPVSRRLAVCEPDEPPLDAEPERARTVLANDRDLRLVRKNRESRIDESAVSEDAEASVRGMVAADPQLAGPILEDRHHGAGREAVAHRIVRDLAAAQPAHTGVPGAHPDVARGVLANRVDVRPLHTLSRRVGGDRLSSSAIEPAAIRTQPDAALAVLEEAQQRHSLRSVACSKRYRSNEGLVELDLRDFAERSWPRDRLRRTIVGPQVPFDAGRRTATNLDHSAALEPHPDRSVGILREEPVGAREQIARELDHARFAVREADETCAVDAPKDLVVPLRAVKSDAGASDVDRDEARPIPCHEHRGGEHPDAPVLVAADPPDLGRREPVGRAVGHEASVGATNDARVLRPAPEIAVRGFVKRDEPIARDSWRRVSVEDNEPDAVESHESVERRHPQVPVTRLDDVDDDVLGQAVGGRPRIRAELRVRRDDGSTDHHQGDKEQD